MIHYFASKAVFHRGPAVEAAARVRALLERLGMREPPVAADGEQRFDVGQQPSFVWFSPAERRSAISMALQISDEQVTVLHDAIIELLDLPVRPSGWRRWKVPLYLDPGARPVPSDEAALLAQVIAEPDRDEPRLVLADLWLERGDPRGAFTIVQCALARGGAGRADLEAEEAALLNRHLRALAPGLWDREPRFERGAVTGVTLSVDDFAHGAEALFAHAPLLEDVHVPHPVEVTDARLLIGSPHLARLRALEILPRLGGLAALLASPATATLRRLVLQVQHDTWGEVLAALGEAEHLVELRELRLHGARVPRDPGDLVRLFTRAAPARLGGLRRLAVGPAGMHDANAAELAGCRALPHLESLDLAGNPVGVAGAIALLESAKIRLRELGLAGCPIAPDDLQRLARAARRAGLRTLDLRGVGGGEAVERALPGTWVRR